MIKMQKINRIFLVSAAIVVFLSLTTLSACKEKNSENSGEKLDKDSSYAFGMLMANQMMGQLGLYGLHFDYQAFADGFKDFNEANETRITQDKAIELISEVFDRMQAIDDERFWLEGTKNREEGEAYMAGNAARSGVRTTESGLQYEVLRQGSGPKPGPYDSVMVDYEGTLIDGTVFDSSYRSGMPIEFALDSVILGWTEGLQLMNEGSNYRFVIPPDLAYGSYGSGPIPPEATLIFTVDLLSVIPE
jgi:FKBP-type peptidyl-prolyl cis-trans isomerase